MPPCNSRQISLRQRVRTPRTAISPMSNPDVTSDRFNNALTAVTVDLDLHIMELESSSDFEDEAVEEDMNLGSAG